MRDPNRIPQILSLIRDLWQTKYSDLRFFQFVKWLEKVISDKDPFFMEDDEVIEKLKKILSETEREA